jgi:hypothetical protein
MEERIRVEVFKLEFSGQLDEGTFRLLRRPSGENLLKDGIRHRYPIHDGVNDVFGIRIINTSGWDLYPSIFYFNNSELSISGSSRYLNICFGPISVCSTIFRIWRSIPV